MLNGSSSLRDDERKGRQMKLASAYLTMKEHVIRMGYSHEIDWQDARSLSLLSEREFLAEGAWVILSSGMRERVVARRYPLVSEAFKDWDSAESIALDRWECEHRALRAFNNPGKIGAIGALCAKVHSCGFRRVVQRIRTEGVAYLTTFDFIGPITGFHLAKNIGVDVVKPDRHLVRMATSAGYSCPEELCSAITGITGEKVSVVDLVLWRYATLDPRYTRLIPRISEAER